MSLYKLSYSTPDGHHSVNLDGDSTSIGRSSSQDVMLNHAGVSRHHAVILRDGNSYTVVDQDSTCGTFLNAVRIKRSILRPGDALHIGSLDGPRLLFLRSQEEESGETEAEFSARLAREELALAAEIHRGLMSIKLPSLPYVEIQARTVPCFEIGGDFYDVVTLNDCVCATIADVSGKGVSAAIVAATLQGIIHTQLLAGESLPDIAAQLNQFLCTRNVGRFATMIVLKLFPDGHIEYINCGHVYPVSILDTRVRRLTESNLVVGLIPEASYTSARIRLQPGERLLLATDGITEAEDNSGRLFGDTGLNAAAQYESPDAIFDHVAKFRAPRGAQDDCTLLEIKYLGTMPAFAECSGVKASGVGIALA